ncbi:hypothetical protein [Sorangium cellulosum]|uniref:N-(5'-phosphoribosyl)anthranilate isomerase n=1 Tax=Sorangium cellulosum TaxID=56 RepID=A0A150QZY1_SORCE|nr:hypothetical protein [Sorangium cellulosum]KYF73118.1 hypothetical protein BE15_35870 [Sorangium cellulosum]
MHRVKVQIFCRRPSLAEMDALFAMGVDLVGWAVEPRADDALDLSRRIVERARRAEVGTCLLILSSTIAEIEAVGRMVSSDYLLTPTEWKYDGSLRELATRLAPQPSLMTSVPVRAAGSSAVLASDEIASQLDEFAGCLILDTCLDPSEPQRSGFTGKVADWQHCARIVKASRRPVMLAGGLNRENVVAAIREVSPWAVDACTSLELPDRTKDLARCEAFIEAVHAMS